jgi:hypothetical protein
VCSIVSITIIAEMCGRECFFFTRPRTSLTNSVYFLAFTCIPAILNEYRTAELNVRTGCLKALSFASSNMSGRSLHTTAILCGDDAGRRAHRSRSRAPTDSKYNSQAPCIRRCWAWVRGFHASSHEPCLAELRRDFAACHRSRHGCYRGHAGHPGSWSAVLRVAGLFHPARK